MDVFLDRHVIIVECARQNTTGKTGPKYQTVLIYLLENEK